MSDVVTVLRKEMIEATLDWQSLRGSLVQGLVIVSVAGLLLPAVQPGLWNQPALLMGVFFVFPSLITASLGAESFAGERERKTLETLLATPLSDSAVFFGKAAWVVSHALGVALVILALGVATTAVGAHAIVRAPSVLAAIVTSFAAASSTAAIAVGVSSRVPAARSAQQLATLLSMSLCGAAFWILRVASPGWVTLYALDYVLIAGGAIGLILSMLAFRRDRLFDHR